MTTKRTGPDAGGLPPAPGPPAAPAGGGASSPRGRPRELSDEALLDAALRAFGRLGYEGVSLRELNRELGKSPAMLARRFGTKEELWLAALERGFDRHHGALLAELAALPPEPEPGLATLERLVEAFVRTAARVPALHQVVSVEGATDSPRLDHVYTRFVEPLFVGLVRPQLEPLVAKGVIRPVSDREVFFLVAQGAASVAALEPLARRFDARDGPLDLDTWAASVARLLVNALRP